MDATASPGLQGSAKLDQIKEQLRFVVRQGTRARAIFMVGELKRMLEQPEVLSHLDEGVLNYVMATIALSFLCRDVYEENVSKLLYALGIIPNKELFEVLHALRYKNYNVYINVLYFMDAFGIQPSVDGIIDVLKAMEVSPDAIVARHAMEYYQTMDKKNINPEVLPQGGQTSEIFKRSATLIYKLSDVVAEFIIGEGDKIYANLMIDALREKMVPYIIALGFLALSGRDLDADLIDKTLGSVGFEADRLVLAAFSALKVRNHVVYITSLYMMGVVGMEPNMENLIRVVRSLGVNPDMHTATYALSAYKVKF